MKTRNTESSTGLAGLRQIRDDLTRLEFLRRSISALGLAGVGVHLNACAGRPAPAETQPSASLSGRKKAVIIGSGISGLVAGALLARIGYEVRVLEMHPTRLGGHARTVEIEGLLFCLGPQYVWNFGPDTVGDRVLSFLGLKDQVAFEPMDRDGFEHIVVGDHRPFAVPMGLDRFRHVLAKDFPDETEGLSRFFRALDDLFAAARVLHDRGLYLESGWTMRMALLFSSGLNWRVKFGAYRMSGWSLGMLFDRCHISEGLRRVLYGHGGIFAECESEVSAGVYAAATGYYHQGAVYPKNGFVEMLASLSGVIENFGGDVLLDKKVTSLGQNNGLVVEVHCADGTSYPSDLVISNLSPRLTCALIEDCQPQRLDYEPSNTLLACCVGLKGFPEIHQRLRGRNLWWQDGAGEVDFSNPNMLTYPRLLYVGSPSANGVSGTGNGKAEQSLILFAPGNYAQAKMARDKGEMHFNSFKKAIASQIIEVLERSLLPGVAQHVVFAEVFTPMEIEEDTGSERGNVYGRRLTVDHIISGVRLPSLPENLSIACATTGLPGISTGFQTARLLVERLTGVEI